jgi:hypothetical protein
LYFGRNGKALLTEKTVPEAGALAFAPGASIQIAAADLAALAYLEEYFGASLAPTAGGAEWRLRIEASGEGHARLLAGRPADPEPAPWFAFDQSVFSLPSWKEEGGRLMAFDQERGCVLGLRPGDLQLWADPDRLRWRFTAVMAIQEMIGANLRSRALETHCAAIGTGGRAIAIAGPKGAGKTTLSLNLLRGGADRWIANDRAFLEFEAGDPVVRGMPTSLRIPPALAAEFPELVAGLAPGFGRHHIHSSAELEGRPPVAGQPPGEEAMLSLTQAAAQIGVATLPSAPLGALLFPRVEAGAGGWRIQPLSADRAAAALSANLFGSTARPRAPTVFERAAGASSSPPPEIAEGIAAAVPSYAVTLGPGASGAADFAARFLAEIGLT